MHKRNITGFKKNSGTFFIKDNQLYANTSVCFDERYLYAKNIDSGLKAIGNVLGKSIFPLSDVTIDDIKLSYLSDEEVMSIATVVCDLWELMQTVAEERFAKAVSSYDRMSEVRSWVTDFMYFGGVLPIAINSLYRGDFNTIGSIFEDYVDSDDELVISKVRCLSYENLIRVYGCIKLMTEKEASIAVKAINGRAVAKKDVISMREFVDKTGVTVLNHLF